ncbi:hypothetical protein [Neisseria wadsworthii]|uniref:Uncharacterized protein n=1 Tax=Neisseria wadsworthii 9715 TaxID=1030841 RepID=G4CNJ0_9NEIS|nr:hypothetical protein [Neisseria wadsworthii]EGZ49586.1 hypothetical protein HMPREF9370_0649 [Neisseria wadsworthii 9715]QMT36612.1 hypothetical protein H3L96_05265 [Neisseria wadsworthii]
MEHHPQQSLCPAIKQHQYPNMVKTAILTLSALFIFSACSVQTATWYENVSQEAEILHAISPQADGSLILHGRQYDYRLSKVPPDLHQWLNRHGTAQLYDLSPNPQTAPAQANLIELNLRHNPARITLRRLTIYTPPTPELVALGVPLQSRQYPQHIRRYAAERGISLPEHHEWIALDLRGLQGEAWAPGTTVPKYHLPILLHLNLQRHIGTTTRRDIVPLKLCCW